MSLQAVFDAVKPVIAAAVTRDGGMPPTIVLGAIEGLPNPGALPAIVWVPKGGPVVPARQSGVAPVSNPRHLWTRQEIVHMYVFAGVGFEETEVLVTQLVQAMLPHLTTWSFRVTNIGWSYGWPVPSSDEIRADLDSGTLCVVSCELSIPLVAEKMRVARPTTATITGTMNPPGGA